MIKLIFKIIPLNLLIRLYWSVWLNKNCKIINQKYKDELMVLTPCKWVNNSYFAIMWRALFRYKKSPDILSRLFHIWFLAVNSCQRPHPVFLVVMNETSYLFMTNIIDNYTLVVYSLITPTRVRFCVQNIGSFCRKLYAMPNFSGFFKGSHYRKSKRD